MSRNEAGGLFQKHLAAMTAEDLNSKSAIAAELAYRDKQILDLKRLLQEHHAYAYSAPQYWGSPTEKKTKELLGI